MMKKFFKGIVVTIVLAAAYHANAGSLQRDPVFAEIYQHLEQKDFFTAKELYQKDKAKLSDRHRKFTEAVLANAFNKVEESEAKISALIDLRNFLPDSLAFKLHEVRHDNLVKMYRYRAAGKTAETILKNYPDLLDPVSTADYKNSSKLWKALENVPAQKVVVKGATTIQMKKDLAGLNTLKVRVGDKSSEFIFDTGANLSTTSASVAKSLNMKIIPADIEVGTITGTTVFAQLGICEKLMMGDVDLYNVVFLVLPDEALYFAQIDYRIYGILGFPVIEALGEIRLTQDGRFIVSEAETAGASDASNMAMDGLTPLIRLNNKHFTFDTGARNSMLYGKFYREKKAEFDGKYDLQKINMGGAGGVREFDGFIVNYPVTINGKLIQLENVSLLTDDIKESNDVYGNIGQDLIKKFDTMILNFNQMFVRFE